ncbi:hypothetical protein B0H19DRAFT_1240722 [Mycena capillaripes]|nr:hypothetical protein B0H19DRAFT_1240722 [Mycena capillaripes]
MLEKKIQAHKDPDKDILHSINISASSGLGVQPQLNLELTHPGSDLVGKRSEILVPGLEALALASPTSSQKPKPPSSPEFGLAWLAKPGLWLPGFRASSQAKHITNRIWRYTACHSVERGCPIHLEVNPQRDPSAQQHLEVTFAFGLLRKREMRSRKEVKKMLCSCIKTLVLTSHSKFRCLGRFKTIQETFCFLPSLPHHPHLSSLPTARGSILHGLIAPVQHQAQIPFVDRQSNDLRHVPQSRTALILPDHANLFSVTTFEGVSGVPKTSTVRQKWRLWERFMSSAPQVAVMVNSCVRLIGSTTMSTWLFLGYEYNPAGTEMSEYLKKYSNLLVELTWNRAVLQQPKNEKVLKN